MSSTFIRPVGVCFCTADPVDATRLANVLRKVASAFQTDDPYVRLHRYDDWWEHDGLHFHREVIDFDALFSLLSSPKTLLESTPSDDSVFVGVGPESGKWYLRYRVDWDDDEKTLIGECAIIFDPVNLDLTSELESVDSLKKIDADTYYTETIL